MQFLRAAAIKYQFLFRYGNTTMVWRYFEFEETALYLSPVIAALALSCALSAAPPSIGENAPDFELTSVLGPRVNLTELTARAQVVLVVLRGYPGYQCPYCQRQVMDFAQRAQAF